MTTAEVRLGELSRLARFLSSTISPGTCNARQKEDGYGPLVWILIGLASISVAYGNGYVMIPSYSLFAPVSLCNNRIIQLFTHHKMLPAKRARRQLAASFLPFLKCTRDTKHAPRRPIKPDVILSMT